MAERLEDTIRTLLNEPGVDSIEIFRPEEDDSLPFTVKINTQIGLMHHMTACESIDHLSERIVEMLDEDELDPR